MRNKIQQAFDPIQATPILKKATKEYLSRKLYGTPKKVTSLRYIAVALACFTVLLLGSGYYTYMIPVSVISIDVNPSIELRINRFDRVVSVEGYNEGGKALVPFLSVTHLPYEQAVEAILAQEEMERYLARGELLSMTVAGKSEKQSEQMLSVLSQYATQENISCHEANVQEVNTAHGHGLSVGKYSAYLALCELDPSVTVAEVKHLTMRQIRDRIGELSGGEDLPQGKGSRKGSGHGGNGHRGGRN